MKKVCMLMVLGSIVVTGCHSQQAEKTECLIKSGTILTYDIKQNEKNYQFIVSVKTVEPDIAFDWRMTEPVNSAGDITIPAEALNNATGQHNYFLDGSSLHLKEKTSVWISRKVYSDLIRDGKTTITFGTIDGGDQTLSLLEKTTMPVTVNGRQQDLPILSAETEKGNRFRILDNAQHPIILSMSLGFDITIKAIDNVK